MVRHAVVAGAELGLRAEDRPEEQVGAREDVDRDDRDGRDRQDDHGRRCCEPPRGEDGDRRQQEHRADGCRREPEAGRAGPPPGHEVRGDERGRERPDDDRRRP
jgi:hypothetical protein